jgi:hypothetical protein
MATLEEDPRARYSIVETLDHQERFIIQTLASSALRYWPDCFMMENFGI